MDLIMWFMSEESRTVITVIAVAGFFLSEALSLIPAVKSNGLFQLVANVFRKIVISRRPELLNGTGTIAGNGTATAAGGTAAGTTPEAENKHNDCP